jgi:hypothetical protein
MSAYPDDFSSWSEDRRNAYFAREAEAYGQRKRSENGNGARAPNNIADFVVAAAAKPARKRPTRSLPDWASRCIFDDYGRIIPNLANVLIALRALPEVRDAFAYDAMSCCAILRQAMPVAPNGESASSAPLPRAVRDEDVSQLQEWLQHQGMPKIGKDQVHQAVDQRAMECAFHPVRDYLNGLPWDKTHRLDNWLATYLGAPKGAYEAKIAMSYADDAGGADSLTEAQRTLVATAATLTVQSELLKASLLRGEAVDVEQLTRIANVLGRTLQRLGIKKRAERKLSVPEYLAARDAGRARSEVLAHPSV